MIKPGDFYKDGNGNLWEIFSKSGPGQFPAVGKNSIHGVACFTNDGERYNPVTPEDNLVIIKTLWLGVHDNGRVGVFDERPSTDNRVAIIKVNYRNGQFDD